MKFEKKSNNIAFYKQISLQKLKNCAKRKDNNDSINDLVLVAILRTI